MPFEALIAGLLGILFELLSIPLRWLMGEATFSLLNALLP